MSKQQDTPEKNVEEHALRIQLLEKYFSNLEGKLLTIVDASYNDREQREAIKSIVRETVWKVFDSVNDIAHKKDAREMFTDTNSTVKVED